MELRSIYKESSFEGSYYKTCGSGLLFPNEEYFESWLINEVPLKSCADTKMNMPLWFWNLAGRLQWFINCRRQAEGHRQTRERAKEFVELIKSDDMDLAVVTHGFYMHTLLQEIKSILIKDTTRAQTVGKI